MELCSCRFARFEPEDRRSQGIRNKLFRMIRNLQPSMLCSRVYHKSLPIGNVAVPCLRNKRLLFSFEKAYNTFSMRRCIHHLLCKCDVTPQMPDSSPPPAARVVVAAGWAAAGCP